MYIKYLKYQRYEGHLVDVWPVVLLSVVVVFVRSIRKERFEPSLTVSNAYLQL